VFVLRDLGMQRIYRLHDITKAQLIRPFVAHSGMGKVKDAGKLDVVIESVQPDIKHTEFSTIPVHIDGAGGSAIF